jgi:hypothetical protein
MKAFSWEYPGKEGLPCNKVDPADSANFLAFLQQLRGTSDGQDLVLTAAVGITPFVGSDGAPMNDVSEFAKVLDRIGMPPLMCLVCYLYRDSADGLRRMGPMVNHGWT